MPTIVEYERVLEQLQGQGLRNLYHNAGAFGFARDANVRTVAWIGPDDSTIRETARPFVRAVAPPYEITLASLLRRAWTQLLPGPIWLMPMSHWHYEMHFGNASWLAASLERIGIDPALLRDRNNGSAIEFLSDEAPALESLVQEMIRNLAGSDFLAAFPARPALCTLHHHKQLWWQTTEEAIAAALDAIVQSTQ